MLLPNFIEIETSTYCNRRCGFCPNSVYDRGTKQKLIDDGLFKKIVIELGCVGYKGTSALHNYNEPLFDPFLYEHLETLAENIPDSKRMILTNGDILTREKLTKLDAHGANLVRIALYSSNQSPIEAIITHAKSLGLNAQPIITDEGVVSKLKFNNMDVSYLVPNRDLFTNRGGLLKKRDFSDDCYLPLVSSAIDVEGNMKICCEVYPAYEIHRRFGIVGNLKDKTFLDLWFSVEYNQLRAELLKHDRKNEICRSCRKVPKSSRKVTSEIIAEWEELLKNGHLFD